MNNSFVFGDIIASEINSNPNNILVTYEFRAPYCNPKLQTGIMTITFDIIGGEIQDTNPTQFAKPVGNIHRTVAVGYDQYITAVASFVPQGPTGPINSQTIISKPIVIKSKVKPQTTQDGLVPVPVIQPVNVSQSPTQPENSFNLGIAQVSIIFAAFLLLLIFLYIGWRKENK